MNAPKRSMALSLLCLMSLSNIVSQEKDCSNYLIPLLLRTPEGEIIRNVSPSDLVLRFNGNVLPIDSVHNESRPRRIVILLDASGSMNYEGSGLPWKHAVAAAAHLASLADRHAQLALLIFNEQIVEQIPFEQGDSKIINRLAELASDTNFERSRVHGKTAINDAIVNAFSLLGRRGTADSLYIVSDGINTAGHTPSRDLESRVLSSGVRVFSIILHPAQGWQSHRRLEDILGTGPDLLLLSRITGGASMSVDEEETKLSFDVGKQLSSPALSGLFFAGMFDNELLQFTISGQIPKKRELKIELSAAGKAHFKGAQLAYPNQLYVCSASEHPAEIH